MTLTSASSGACPVLCPARPRSPPASRPRSPGSRVSRGLPRGWSLRGQRTPVTAVRAFADCNGAAGKIDTCPSGRGRNGFSLPGMSGSWACDTAPAPVVVRRLHAPCPRPARTQLVKTGQREGAVGVGGIWLADPLSPGPRIALSAETGHLVWRQGHQPAPGAGFLSPFGLPLGPGPCGRPAGTCRHPPPPPPERLCASSRPRLLPGPQRSAVRRLRPPLVSYGDGVSHQMALSASGFRPQAARASTAWKNSHGMAFDQRGDEAAGDMLPS